MQISLILTDVRYFAKKKEEENGKCSSQPQSLKSNFLSTPYQLSTEVKHAQKNNIIVYNNRYCVGVSF
jgi:hypothetical protein